MAKKFIGSLSDENFGLGDSAADIYLNDDGAGAVAQNTVRVNEIKIPPGRRALDAEKVAELVKSVKDIGLMNPITITADNTLVAGAHRLQAFKDMGLEEIPATYLETENETLIELAEIDENLIRSNLRFLENGQALRRRKEIYETLHPETKRGGDRKSEKIKTRPARFDFDGDNDGVGESGIGGGGGNSGVGGSVSVGGDNDGDIVSGGADPTQPARRQTDEPPKSFAEDTAAKTGQSARKIQEDIQISENLTARAKEAIIEHDAQKKEALLLSRMKPEKQDEVIDRIAAAGSLSKAIRAVNQEAIKALPKFEPQKQNVEAVCTDEEKRLYLKKSRIISRVKETAEHLKYLDEKDLRGQEIKPVIQIYKGKNGGYTFRAPRGKRGGSGYVIPDGYSIYRYNDTERLILNGHGLICYLGADEGEDVPVIIDGDALNAEDRKTIAFARGSDFLRG